MAENQNKKGLTGPSASSVRDSQFERARKPPISSVPKIQQHGFVEYSGEDLGSSLCMDYEVVPALDNLTQMWMNVFLLTRNQLQKIILLLSSP